MTIQPWTAKEYPQPILREEVEIAVAGLKKGGLQEFIIYLVQAGGETVIDVLKRLVARSGKQENGRPIGLIR